MKGEKSRRTVDRPADGTQPRGKQKRVSGTGYAENSSLGGLSDRIKIILGWEWGKAKSEFQFCSVSLTIK